MKRVAVTVFFVGVLLLCSGFTGCEINGTGLGSCFLGGSGPGCLGTPNFGPGQFPTGGGFELYTLFKVQNIDKTFRADSIQGVQGKLAPLSDTATEYGMATVFGPEPSGPANVPPPNTVDLDPGAGLVNVPDGKVPATWLINWGATTYLSQWAGYLNQTFGPLKDLEGHQWPGFCNGNIAGFNIQPGQRVPYRCMLYNCSCQVQQADAFSPNNYAQPSTEEAGNLVDMTVTPALVPTGGYVYGQTRVTTYDGTGAMVSGPNVSYITITNGGTGFVIPAWALAWADDNRPGDYFMQIQTLVNGNWNDFDSFGFSIIQGGIPVYRYYSPSHGTHYFSQAQDGGNIWPYDYRAEGVGFFAYNHGVAWQPFGSAASFYRLSCCNGGGNGAWLLSDNQTEVTNAENAGWIAGGIVGDIMPTQTSNCNVSPCYTPNIPLYRTTRQTNGNGNFMFTTNYTEYQNMLNQGWTSQGISGYVPSGP